MTTVWVIETFTNAVYVRLDPELEKANGERHPPQITSNLSAVGCMGAVILPVQAVRACKLLGKAILKPAKSSQKAV
jgi:hypothetical protein